MRKIIINSFLDRNAVRHESLADFCVTWLYYPSQKSERPETQHDYLYGAIINKLILERSEAAVCAKVNYCIITPADIPQFVEKIIDAYFDVHICYQTDIAMDFLKASEKHWTQDERDRWRGVMNKLYILHPDLFGCYKKVLFLDCDLLIVDAARYLALLSESATPAGVYEYSNRLRMNKIKTHLVHSKFKNNQVIPKKYCTADTAYYHCINASLLIVRSSEADYETICADIASVDGMYRRMPQLRTHVLYFPEQEYLTNFFAGRWHSVDFRFLSTADSPFHVAGKFWTETFFDRRTGIPSEFWNFFLGC
jgi:hypothetical protein